VTVSHDAACYRLQPDENGGTMWGTRQYGAAEIGVVPHADRRCVQELELP